MNEKKDIFRIPASSDTEAAAPAFDKAGAVGISDQFPWAEVIDCSSLSERMGFICFPRLTEVHVGQDLFSESGKSGRTSGPGPFDLDDYFFGSFQELGQKVVGTPLWAELDTNLRPAEEIAEELSDLMPEKKELVRRLIFELDQCLEPYDYCASWITELKKAGYRVLFLSNWSEMTYKKMKERGELSFEELTDGGIWSFNAHVAKPDTEIYQMLINEYHLDPQRCIFIDDNQENIDTARSLGIPSVRFKGYEDVRNQLAKIDIRW